jgi:hypothetical protein
MAGMNPSTPFSPSCAVSRSRRALFVVAVAAFASAPLAAQPVDNPVTRFYPGLSQYEWTDLLAWDNVTVTAAVADDGLDDLATVQAEIAAISAAGGGVLYFPAGAYDFSDDLLIHDGVVLRGVQPGDGFVADNLDPDRDPASPVDEVDNAKSTLFSLATRFEFPRFVFDKTANDGAGNERRDAFKAIRLNDPYTDSRVGICWIDINRARIEWIDYGETENGMSSSYWAYFGVPWDPAQPFDDPGNMWLRIRGTHWVIFGNRINNAARWDNRTGVSPPNGSQPAWSIWPKRISGQIDTFNYGYQIVANNRLMDKHYHDWDNSKPNGQQPGSSIDDFLIEDYVDRFGNAVGDDWFSYTRGYGIKMNRSVGLDGNDRDYSPTRYPLLYRPGIACRDNWIFVTRRVGIYIGGSGVECIGNYRTDRSWTLHGDLRKKSVIDPTGRQFNTNYGSTQENRGIDITGFDVFVHKNYMLSFRTRQGAYFSTCGEGFLHQEVGGGSPVYNWTITDNFFSGYIGIYKSREIRGLLIRGNTLPDDLPDQPQTPAIYVEADTNAAPYSLQDVLIDGNNARVNAPGQTGRIIGNAGIDNVVVSNNDFGGGTLLVNDGVQLVDNFNVASVTSNPPTLPFDALPVVDVTAPASPFVVAPGAAVTLLIEADDDGTSPAQVSVYREIELLGAATLESGHNLFSFTLTAPMEPGLYYHFVKADGSPSPAYSNLVLIEVSESAGPGAGQPVLFISMASGAQLVLSFDSDDGVLYRLKQGTDLSDFTPVEDIAGDGTRIERTVAAPDPAAFFLLEAVE